MERPAITGRDLALKVGDCVNYFVGSKGKISWGYVQSVANANIRVDDRSHYGKSVLRQRHDVIDILTAPPANSPPPKNTMSPRPSATPRSTIAPINYEFETDGNTDSFSDDSESESRREWWAKREYKQPEISLKGSKTTKIIAGEEITLWSGYQYSTAIPTDRGRILASAENSGKITIWVVENNSRGDSLRGKDVLYISIHPSKYDQFRDEFPSFTNW